MIKTTMIAAGRATEEDSALQAEMEKKTKRTVREAAIGAIRSVKEGKSETAKIKSRSTIGDYISRRAITRREQRGD